MIQARFRSLAAQDFLAPTPVYFQSAATPMMPNAISPQQSYQMLIISIHYYRHHAFSRHDDVASHRQDADASFIFSNEDRTLRLRYSSICARLEE